MSHRHFWPLIVGLLLSLWVLNASRIGPLESCLEGCATFTEEPEGPLRVMSLNILHGFPKFDRLPRRLDLVIAEIQTRDADIVLLQEVPWTLRLGSGAKYLASRIGMNYVYLPANGNRWAILFSEGEAILSRFPLKDVTFTELRPRPGFFEHRVALKASIITPWGEVRAISTHLTNGASDINRQQAEALMDFVSTSGDGLAIVGGDFNAREDTPQIQALADAWIDTYRAIHPQGAGLTCCVDNLRSEREPLEERIDYIFVVPSEKGNAWILYSQRVLDRPFWIENGWLWASDHVGLFVVIEIQLLRH